MHLLKWYLTEKYAFTMNTVKSVIDLEMSARHLYGNKCKLEVSARHLLMVTSSREETEAI
jgi:hypothetical protein